MIPASLDRWAWLSQFLSSLSGGAILGMYLKQGEISQLEGAVKVLKEINAELWDHLQRRKYGKPRQLQPVSAVSTDKIRQVYTRVALRRLRGRRHRGPGGRPAARA
jgi:hypothetical protein